MVRAKRDIRRFRVFLGSLLAKNQGLPGYPRDPLGSEAESSHSKREKVGMKIGREKRRVGQPCSRGPSATTLVRLHKRQQRDGGVVWPFSKLQMRGCL